MTMGTGDPDMKKLALWGLVLVVVAAAGWFGLRGGPLSSEMATAATSPETTLVERRDIGSTVLATGVVRPQVGAEVEVGSRVSGILQRLHVTVGDPVREGQMLAELDPTEFEARHEQTAAALENARVEREFAQTKFDRAERLLASQVMSQAEFDQAERDLRSAAARQREAESSRESARIQLEYTKIRAPISGVVADVTTQEGETVAASFAAPTFVTIIDLDRLEVWAYVDETDIGRIQVGQRARFSVDTYSGTEFQGWVIAIRPMAEIEDNVVNYITVIEISETDGRILRPEMTTTVNIVLAGAEGVLAIPNGAIRNDDGGTYALVRVAGANQRRSIRVGYRGRTHTEVLEGLAESEAVLVGAIEDNP